MDSRARGMLTAARAAMLHEQPFFATLALRLMLEEAPDLVDQTGQPSIMAVNGRVIKYRPDLIHKKTAAELRFILAHEAMHCALQHHVRRGMRDPNLWNIAADHVVNLSLENARVGDVPKDVYADPEYRGLSAETVYSRLAKTPQGGPGQSGVGGQTQIGAGKPEGGAGGKPGQSDHTATGESPPWQGQPGQQNEPGMGQSTGHVEDAPGEEGKPASQAAMDEEGGKWRAALSQAAAVAKARGDLPADIERMIRDTLHPVVDWRAALAAFLTRVREGYSWTRPNRRYIAEDIYLPGLSEERLKDLVIGVDTSGSITRAELAQFAGEVNGVLEQHPGAGVVVVYCDARVHNTEEFTADDLPFELHPQGGGGTRFEPVFEWVDNEGRQPSALVYLTDLDGSFPAAAPNYPVLWVATNDQQAPWGETINLRGRE